jgi:hypothetical protein
MCGELAGQRRCKFNIKTCNKEKEDARGGEMFYNNKGLQWGGQPYRTMYGEKRKSRKSIKIKSQEKKIVRKIVHSGTSLA